MFAVRPNNFPRRQQTSCASRFHNLNFSTKLINFYWENFYWKRIFDWPSQSFRVEESSIKVWKSLCTLRSLCEIFLCMGIHGTARGAYVRTTRRMTTALNPLDKKCGCYQKLFFGFLQEPQTCSKKVWRSLEEFEKRVRENVRKVLNPVHCGEFIEVNSFEELKASGNFR